MRERPTPAIGEALERQKRHGLEEDVPSMRHFSTWLRFKTGWSQSCGWAGAITENSEPGAALETFFSLVERFRALVPTSLSTVQLSEKHQPTGKRATIGFGGRIARPDRIDVVQYRPEPILLLRFQYGERIEDQSTLYTSEGDDATTLRHAKEWVQDEFSVALDEWRDLSALVRLLPKSNS